MAGPWEKYQAAAPAQGPWSKYSKEPTQEKSFGDSASDFAKSFTEGSSIGENMPGGKFLADIGTKAGAGIVAATSAPFSDKGFSEIYDEALAPSTAIREQEAAADAASPLGTGVKTVLAGLPLGAMKSAGAAAPAAAESEAVLGQFSYPKDTAKEKIMEYFSRKQMGGAPGSGSLASKAWPIVKEQAEELLPYPARAALRGYRRITK